jgi:hypothetical protein
MVTVVQILVERKMQNTVQYSTFIEMFLAELYKIALACGSAVDRGFVS